MIRFRNQELKELETVWIRTINDFNKELNAHITPEEMPLEAFVEVHAKALLHARYNQIMRDSIKELRKEK